MDTTSNFRLFISPIYITLRIGVKEKDVNPAKAKALKGVSTTGYSDDTVKKSPYKHR